MFTHLVISIAIRLANSGVTFTSTAMKEGEVFQLIHFTI